MTTPRANQQAIFVVYRIFDRCCVVFRRLLNFPLRTNACIGSDLLGIARFAAGDRREVQVFRHWTMREILTCDAFSEHSVIALTAFSRFTEYIASRSALWVDQVSRYESVSDAKQVLEKDGVSYDPKFVAVREQMQGNPSDK